VGEVGDSKILNQVLSDVGSIIHLGASAWGSHMYEIVPYTRANVMYAVLLQAMDRKPEAEQLRRGIVDVVL